MALSRRTFSARGGGGGCIGTHRTPPAYTPGSIPGLVESPDILSEDLKDPTHLTIGVG